MGILNHRGYIALQQLWPYSPLSEKTGCWARQVFCKGVLAPVLVSVLVSGLLVPQILRPIEVVSMKLAEVMGAVMSRVVLTLAFYLMITPLGFLLKLLGKDLLDLSGERSSYWMPVEKDGPASRPRKPYQDCGIKCLCYASFTICHEPLTCRN